MPELIVVTRAGEERTLHADVGLSVMEAIRDAGIDDLLALCGGCCSCATCHVHIAADFLGKLPPVTLDENDLLDGSQHRDATSRLSCQLLMSEALNGMRVVIAQED